jgi:hypothetical protein
LGGVPVRGVERDSHVGRGGRVVLRIHWRGI